MGPNINWESPIDMDALKKSGADVKSAFTDLVSQAQQALKEEQEEQAAKAQTSTPDAFRRKELDPPKQSSTGTTTNGVSAVSAFSDAPSNGTGDAGQSGQTTASGQELVKKEEKKTTKAGNGSSGASGSSSKSSFDPSKLAVGVRSGPSNIDTLPNAPGSDYFNQVPDMPPAESLADTKESKTLSVGEVVAVTGVAITGIAVAALAAGFASGLIQRYARKKAAQAGVGGMWSKIACVPSFVNPVNPFVKFPVYADLADFQENEVQDLSNAWPFYKSISRTAHCAITKVTSSDGGVVFEPSVAVAAIEPADNWGGWHDFHVTVADNRYHVIAFLVDGSAVAEKEGSDQWYVLRAATFGEVANGRLAV